MTLAFLKSSRLTWQRREKYRYKKWQFYKNESRRPQRELEHKRQKWFHLWEKAHAKRVQRDREIISKEKENRDHANKTSGVGSYDGVPVANVAIPYLQWARSHGWKGRLVSGWRDPEYSRQLCQRICGANSCPGRCAGTSSNHVGSTKDRFAIDVSDYQRFGQLMRQCPISPRIFNGLGARDPVHFSPTGV